MSFSRAGKACSIALGVLFGQSGERFGDELDPGAAPGRHPAGGRGGELQPGRAPVVRVGFAVQQPGFDELVHQGADRVGRQVQLAGGRRDADTGVVGDHAQDLDLRAGQGEAGHVGAHPAAHHPADALDGAQQPFGEFGHAAKVALTQNY